MAPHKVVQETVVKESTILPPRELDTQHRIEMVGNKQRVITEQEIIERQHREEEARKKKEERERHKREWAGKSPAEILMHEMLKLRPKLRSEPTFSVRPTVEGEIQVHLYGNVDMILEHVVKHSEHTMTWHITAQGALSRLRRMAVQPSRPLQVKQHQIYEEQADLLQELARVAGLLDDPELQHVIKSAETITDESVRAKTKVNTYFMYLRKRLGELECQTSPAETPEEQLRKITAEAAGIPAKVEIPAASPPRRRRRHRQPESPPAASPRRRRRKSPSESESAGADSPTTSTS